MLNIARLAEYQSGLQKQRDEALRALNMIDGALQLAAQLMAELETGDEQSSPGTEQSSESPLVS